MSGALFSRFMFTGVGAAALAIAGQSNSTPEVARQKDFFESKVRPLLAKNCLACHGDLKSGGLQLDTREHLLQGGEHGPGVVLDDLENSLLVQAIGYAHSELKMPPTGKLQDEDISILKTWIKGGAVWGETSPASAVPASSEYRITSEQRAFWSFQPVLKPPAPIVKDRSWVRSPIDAFVLAKLEANGLKPVRPADRRTLIRRATLDLTGLPPTPEEVEAFVQDKQPKAFEKVVDRLLASPHYGERWGRFWLDIARYSDDQLNDTEEDLPMPNAFRYRDWVVEAFNADMPYDQFVKAQIAGDLLPNCDVKKFIGGLGFYALSPNPNFHEDRVDATGRGFLGLTVACAQCHNHKYDPIPTKDYYSMLGVFESSEAGEFPLVPAPVVAEYQEQKRILDEQKAALKKFLENQRAQLVDIFAGRAADYIRVAWQVLGPERSSAEDVAQSADLDREVLNRWLFFLQPGRKHEHNCLDAWQHLLGAGGSAADADKVAAEFQSRIRAALDEKIAVDEKNAKATAQTKQSDSPKFYSLERNNHYLLQDLSAPPISGPKKKFEGGPLYFSEAEIARFEGRVWKDHLNALNSGVNRLQAALPPQYPFLPIIKDKSKPENLHVYIRGDKENQGEEAPRRFLTILTGGEPALFTNGSGRLDLAEAIANPRNPLTARVMVNRIWQWHFGAGIVRTPSNFGNLGEPPTHPELLDYLASRFVESGWSIKALHRAIMLSSTYALSADYSAVNFDADPEDKLLWRANVRRLDAEAIRDSLLFVSGKLDGAIGGPAISLADETNVRRTIYGFVSRRKLDRFLRLFDFPDPTETSERRSTTNVPLQQLFFLNSDFVRAQAEALCKRMDSGPSEREKIQRVYQLLFSRTPTQEELRYGYEFISSAGKSWPQYVQVLLSSNEFNFVN